jgi:hypothetical protein
VAWRLCESHLRGIRTPTDSHSIESRSHESVKPTKLEARDRGINPLATNNPSSPNQDLVAWRLCESHLRGIRTPPDSHSIASRSDESVKPTNLEVRDRGINPLATNNPSSPNQDLVAWRLCESHLRGIRTPTDSHSIASRSDESVKPSKLKARDRGINPFRYPITPPAARTRTWWLGAFVRAICAESAHQLTRTASRQDLTNP